jgi:hypothetical protein
MGVGAGAVTWGFGVVGIPTFHAESFGVTVELRVVLHADERIGMREVHAGQDLSTIERYHCSIFDIAMFECVHHR